MRDAHATPARRPALAVLVLLAISCAGGPPDPPPAPPPAAPSDAGALRLVVLLAIDQLRPDRVDARLPGGIGRIAREGRWFVDAALEHARTETCAGHVTMLTGRQPSGTGLPGNSFIDRERLEVVYCVEDRSSAGRVLGAGRGSRPQDGRSPRELRVTALGDWLKAAQPTARVFAVSAKDRSAIVLGGRGPDGVYWLDRRRSGAMTTSRYYRRSLPDWLERWDAEGLLAPVPLEWVHDSGDPPNGTRRDAFKGESPIFSMTSPHPVKPEGDTPGSMGAFVRSPFLDGRTLDFARDLVVEERLGAAGAPDLLAIGLSGTDYIGHSYGPWSQESRDALLRLDRDIGAFLHFLDGRIGRGNVLVVLTSDHGVLPLPEWLEGQAGACSVPGGRIDTRALEVELLAHLDEVLGGEGVALEGEGWFVRDGFELVLDPARVASAGIGMERALDVVEQWIEERPGVARVWRGTDVAAGRGPEPMLTLYRNAWVEERHPDLVIEPAHGCLFSSWPDGTTHGSPHDYDRAVPLLFMGPDVDPGRVTGRAGPVDIAPTLARELGLEPPPGLDGRVLPLRDAVAD